MILAKQLSPTSWIMKDEKTEKSLGIVKLSDEKYTLFGKKDIYDSLESVAQALGGELVEADEENSEEVISEINGYPIKHKGACEFDTKEIAGKEIKTYKTKVGSKKVYIAGWVGLTFKNSLVLSLCPKFKTIEDNGFIGPFKTKLDLDFHAKKYNMGELPQEQIIKGKANDDSKSQTGT